MTINELIKKAKKAAKTRTEEETDELFRRAKIFDKNGDLCAGFFSEENIRRDKESRAALRQAK